MADAVGDGAGHSEDQLNLLVAHVKLMDPSLRSCGA